MSETLTFSYNWNGKLYCPCFSTIRLRNDQKYYIGAELNIQLNKRSLGKGIVRSITHFKIHRINDAMAYLDTGKSAFETQQLLLTMYKNKRVDWNYQELSFVIIERPGKSVPKLIDQPEVTPAEFDNILTDLYQGYIQAGTPEKRAAQLRDGFKKIMQPFVIAQNLHANEKTD